MWCLAIVLSVKIDLLSAKRAMSFERKVVFFGDRPHVIREAISERKDMLGSRGVHLVYFGTGTWDNGVFYMGVLIKFWLIYRHPIII